VLELWGLGDIALAMPFLRVATNHLRVTLVAKPNAAPVLNRFCPTVELLPFTAPWTAFTGKYRLHEWPWGKFNALRHALKAQRFNFAASARPDPRDHVLLAMSGARQRIGFPSRGSGFLLTDSVAPPSSRHRAEYWRALGAHLGFDVPATNPPRSDATTSERNVIIHTGAGHAVRRWPRGRFEELARRLRASGWKVTMIDDSLGDLSSLLDVLATGHRFIGNDSGPGHLAALLGIPTFTIFGPQLPELFAPRHPQAAWIEGAPCPYKPCFDACRFAEPHCLVKVTVEQAWSEIREWLTQPIAHPRAGSALP
jgi:ADP-heptose:LPS heptosyltransferase